MEEQKIETTPVQDNPITQNPMAPAKPKKKGKGMLIGMIFLAVLAVAGISFGVWTMLDSKTQKQQLNDQISSLKQQNNELEEKLSNESSPTADGESADLKKSCEGTYYGEWTEKKENGITLDLKYTYILQKNGTFTADYSNSSEKAGTYTINDNTISLTGTKDTAGPRESTPLYATEDAIIADDCSYIRLAIDGEYKFDLKKQ